MIIKVISGNKIKELCCTEGELLSDVILRNSLPLMTDCGGQGRCGKCRVKLIEGSVSGTSPDENGYILSCRAKICGQCTVKLRNIAENEKLQENKNISGISSHDFGIAFDLGSTTLAFSLVDMTEKKTVESFSVLNRQAKFGADVISRISACTEGKLQELHGTVVSQLKDAEIYFRKKYGYASLKKICVAGNTAMLHIFMNISPESIGVAPYTPVFTERKITEGKNFSIPCDYIEILPSCGAFIGADITSGAAYLGLSDGEMLIDLGTNGEIMYRKNGRYYAASAAAGPCLEGASTECGTGGIKGAVNKVYEEEGRVKFETVGNFLPPCGICGAGLNDLVALLLRKNIINETGLLDNEEGIYYLTDDIYISSADVREFQLAKSAVYSAISTLLYETGEKAENIKTFYLSGGIGYHIDIGNAVFTGLLPEAIKDRTVTAGNTSLKGAEKCLTDSSFSAAADFISENTGITDLNSSKFFADSYIMNMMFNK